MIVTLGAEEELQAVDGETGALVSYDVDAARAPLTPGIGGIAREMHRCAVELQTPICSHPDQIAESLSMLRAVARKQAERDGQRVAAAGLHPFSSWLGQQLYDDPRRHPHYRHLLEEFCDIARRAVSFGLHVHLGLPRAELRIPVMNALRSTLPEVLALSVNSPFHEGRDTGIASWRHSVLGRYPRMGIPDAWPDEAAYLGHIARLRRLGALEPDQGMWDDLRLHHHYGTLEVRICDTIFSLDRVWLIVALLQCEAATLVGEATRGTLPEPEPRMWIEENKWRARRHGLDAALIDWRRDEAVPTAIRYERWLARLLPAAVELGLWPRIELALIGALAEGTGADRQRVWLREGGSFGHLVKSLAYATAVPWFAPTPTKRNRREIDSESAQPQRSRPAAPADVRIGRAPSGAAGRTSRRMGPAPRRTPPSD